METAHQMDLAKYQESMTPQRVRTFQIMFGALLAGATVFLGAVLLIYMNSVAAPAQQGGNVAVLPILTLVHVLEGTAGYVAAFFCSPLFYGFEGG